MDDLITIHGARQHNLRNVTLSIPRHKLVVFTGVSGSGKSSLAFHTLFAEGQRRYVESLSAYARQFLDQLEKPDVDRIEGLSPAIAIEQRTSAPNPRSTVATATEIYDYLRVLFSSVGTPHDPNSGRPLVRETPGQIADDVESLPARTRLVLLAPLPEPFDGKRKQLFKRLGQQGFVRVRVGGEILDLEEIEDGDSTKGDIELVIDRLVVKEGIRSRLVEAIEACVRMGDGEVRILVDPEGENEELRSHSTDYRDPESGYRLPPITPRSFSFNAAQGACPGCHGLGHLLSPDRELIVPDDTLSLSGGAVKTWWARNPKLKKPLERQILSLAGLFEADPEAPFASLPEGFRKALFDGSAEAIATGWKTGPDAKGVSKPFEGLCPQAERLHSESKSETVRRNVRKFLSPTECNRCRGRRLRPEILGVTLRSTDGTEKAIDEVCRLSIDEAAAWCASLDLSRVAREVCDDVLSEIQKRVQFLCEVGLGYLTLERGSSTLSGGEAQRIRLATQIGGALSGVLYVLDEPSIGLHQEDNERLIGTLRRLRDLGNSVVVVEHDEDTIRAADYLVDLGPGAGEEGGLIMAAGTPGEVERDPDSPTGLYLSGARRIAVPKNRRPSPTKAPPAKPSGDALLENGWITVHGARANNLQEVDASIPIGALVCVTGVSGSGKSTLIDGILRKSISRQFHHAKAAPGAHDGISGLGQIDKCVVVDQAPIGKSPRSNPATYVGLFGPLRTLFSKLPASRVRGYGPGRFSFNVKGGRCEACAGDGAIRIDMHFLNDVFVKCEACQGRRYNAETLEILYKGKSIADVLAMTIREAERFFLRIPEAHSKLRTLCEVGLGYLRLGQAANTLSGGEAQRIKLAAELAKKSTGRTLFLLDEPTTGLHFADVEVLLGVFYKLRDLGNTLVIIEHNLDVVKCADWVIDLGPGGGKHGGRIVAEGSPEKIAAHPDSVTGRWLTRVLDQNQSTS